MIKRLFGIAMLTAAIYTPATASPPGGNPSLPTTGLSAEEVLNLRNSNKLSEDVLDALTESDSVDVIVVFDVPFKGKVKGQEKIREWVDSVTRQRQAVINPYIGKGLTIHRSFEAVNSVFASITANTLTGLTNNPNIIRVYIPPRMHANLTEAGSIVNIAQAHQASLSDGQGGTIAILDSGIRSTHVDFGGRVIGEYCYCLSGCCPDPNPTDNIDLTQEMGGAGSADDDNGHGTHVAGIAAGNGFVQPSIGVGAEPSASIFAYKILDANGAGNFADLFSALSSILTNPGTINVINLSLGGGLYNTDCDNLFPSLRDAITNLRNNNIATIVATGNDNSTTGISAPACISSTISVGNTYDADVGGRIWGNGLCTDVTTQADQVVCSSNRNANTDLYAPGAMITSSHNLNDTATETWGGTSMSAPLVAGCVGLILNDFPNLTVNQVETELKASPTVIFDATSQTSIPRLDCGDAYTSAQNISTTPPPVFDMAWLVPVINLVLF